MSDPRAGWRPPSFEEAARGDVGAAGASSDPERELERVREQAFARGLAEGREAGRQEVALVAEQMRQLLASMAAPYRAQSERLDLEVQALVAALVRAVVRAEALVNPALIETLVPEILAQLRDRSSDVELVLNPDDRIRVEELLGDVPGLRLRDEPLVSRGGCQLEAPGWFVDASLERRISDVMDGVLDAPVTDGLSQACDGQGQ